MSSRPLFLAILALAFASPAWAASDEAPGTLKKQDTTATEVPAVTQTQTAPIPQAEPTPTATQPQAAEPKATLPVTKGTAKKVVVETPGTGESVADGSAEDAAPAATRKTRRSAKRRSSGSTTRSRTRAGRRSATRSRRAATRSQRNSAKSGSDAANGARDASAAAVAGSHARKEKARKRAARAAVAREADEETTKPLTSISNAADRVVEVIPGVIVLALVGLVGLCMLLIIRSWAIERQRGKALATSYGVTVEALATAIEAKDHTTGGHIERVRRLGLLLASEMVPREARDPQMEYGFLLHDIGKLAVPDSILRAPGRLSDDDWALMRRHPEEGVRMLSHVPFLDRALDVVKYHHERWDGGGYPEGLAGEEIPLWARIFSVVDTLDAMTAARPYRAPRTYEEALAEIRSVSGTQFDPAVVEALERIDPAKIMPLLEPTQMLEREPAPLIQLIPA